MTEEHTDFKDPLSEDYGGKDEMDVILSEKDDEFFIDFDADPDSITVDEKPSKPQPETTQAVEAPSDSPFEESKVEQPEIRGGDCPRDFQSLVDRVLIQYRLLPPLDYTAIYQELAELSIKSCPTPSLQVLNDELQKVQGAKDRLSEIFVAVVQCHNFKKRAVDILQDAWGKFTEEKNADGRKGDAAFRLSNFTMDFAKVEALLKACSHILKNLDSLHDSLSRRITVYQLTLKLQDIGRGALPDFDFERKGLPDLQIVDQEPLNDEGELPEESF